MILQRTTQTVILPNLKTLWDNRLVLTTNSQVIGNNATTVPYKDNFFQAVIKYVKDYNYWDKFQSLGLFNLSYTLPPSTDDDEQDDFKSNYIPPLLPDNDNQDDIRSSIS